MGANYRLRQDSLSKRHGSARAGWFVVSRVVAGEFLCICALLFSQSTFRASQAVSQLYVSGWSGLSIPVGLSVCRVRVNRAYKSEKTPRVGQII